MYNSYNAIREQQISVFEDTQIQYKSIPFLRDAIKKSLEKQFFIGETDNVDLLPEPKTLPEPNTTVIISKKRSLEAASSYRGKKVCVHNFASATNPGGGVTRGSSAQEETICRCSTLYPCLNVPKIMKAFYWSHRDSLNSKRMDARYNDDCVYTPGVIVFKSDKAIPLLLPEEDWFSVDVITCAAPNLRLRPSNTMNPGSGSEQLKITNSELKALHIKRAERIFEIAKKQAADVLILGAFGCGAFQNPPEVVADAYTEVLSKYQNCFEAIEFAVYCAPGRTQNYDVFKRVLG